MATAERVANCNEHPKATEDEINPADNDFRCPVIGAWVSLSRDSDGKIICSNDGCSHWLEDPENP